MGTSRQKKQRYVFLCLLAVAAGFATGSDAIFRVSPTVIQPTPPLQGINAYRREVWNAHGWSETFEPAVDRRKIWAKGYSNNTIRVDMVHGTYYNTLRSGYYDGYQARIYRWNTNALSYQLIRTDTVSVHRAQTYNDFTESEISVSGVAHKNILRAANTNFVDVGRDTSAGQSERRIWPLQHGTTYWYMVTAVDESGNESEPSPLYEYSVPHPEVAVVANTNIATTNIYITTFTLPDASTNSTYNQPLLHTGGMGGVTWTQTDGTLPNGISVTNENGTWRLKGSPALIDTNGYIFTLQVSDGTHSATRELTLNLPNILGSNSDTNRPAPPTGLTATALNGMTYLTWNPNSEADLAGYRLYRSKASRTGGDHVAELVLSGTGPDVEPEDEIWLQNDFRSYVNPEWASDEKYNTVYNGRGVLNRWQAEVKFTSVKNGADIHLSIDTNNPARGEGSLKISAGSSEKSRVYQFGFGQPNTWWYPLLTNHTYRMRLWVRQDGNIPSASADIYMGNIYLQSAGTGLTNGKHTATGLTTNWQLIEYDFTTPSSYPTGLGNINIEFYGPGTLWIDQVDLFDPVSEVGHARPDMLARLQASAIGSVRTMGGSEYLEGSRAALSNYICDWHERAPNWSVDFGFNDTSRCTLPVMLRLAEDLEADVFYVAGSKTWTLDEWEGFFEYLGGTNPANPYVAKRIAQRGTNTPWSAEFDHIYVSFENEQYWAGGDLTDHTRYARWGEYFFNHIANNSAVYQADPDKFTFVLNGQASQVELLFETSPSAEGYELHGYAGGREQGDITAVYTNFNDNGLRALLSGLYTDETQKEEADHVAELIEKIGQQSGRSLSLSSYETGGSFSVPGLWNIPGSIVGEGPEWETYTKSKAFAVTHMTYRLHRAKVGWDSQNYFDFTAGDKWSSHAFVPNGGHPHPHWVASQMYNNTVRGAMLGVSTLKVPTDTFSPDTNDSLQDITVPMIDAYVQKQSNTYSIILFSRELDTPGVNDGITSVTLEVPFNTASNIVKWHMTGDPRTNNIGSLTNHLAAVKITNQTLSVSSVLSNQVVTVDVAPAAMEIYVFEGTQESPAGSVEVAVNQAIEQTDPTTIVPLLFSVSFSEPVNGFTTNDLVFGGTTAVESALIEEVPLSSGLEYQVQVYPVEAGFITLDIPSGSATGVISGITNSASTSYDNSISITELPIANFDFDNLNNATSYPASLKSAQLASAQWNLGPGLLMAPSHTNCLRVHGFNDVTTLDQAVAEDQYFSLKLTPDSYNGISLTAIKAYCFGLGSSESIWVWVRASDDNFATHTDLTDFNGYVGSYSNPSEVYKPINFASTTGTAVEIRFYLTGNGSDSRIDWFVGDVEDDQQIDIQMTGRVDNNPALNTDWDSDGLPNAWEAQHFNGSTTAADPAAMASNGVNTIMQTYIAGISPTSSTDLFTISGTDGTLWWTAETGRIYSIYWTSNLFSGFQLLESNLTSGIFTDTVNQIDQGFYKIEALLAP